MRMTRAALRAQEAGEELQVQIEGKLREQGLYSQPTSNSSAEPLIHEDVDEHGSNSVNSLEHSDEDDRPALRDITSENYPTVSLDGAVKGYEADENSKSVKKAKSKRGRKAAAKKDEGLIEGTLAETETIVGEEQLIQKFSMQSENTLKEDDFWTTSTSNAGSEISQAGVSEDVLQNSTAEMLDESPQAISNESVNNDVVQLEVNLQEQDGEHAPQTPQTPQTPQRPSETTSKTPKFNPAVHLPMQPASNMQAETTEDSFIEDIKCRSPTKFSQSSLDSEDAHSSIPMNQNMSLSPTRTTNHVPSPSSQRIEDSVDAMDDLEDAIEKFAEDMPMIQALPFESPMRLRKNPARTPARATAMKSASLSAATPGNGMPSVLAKTPVRTPAQSSAKQPFKTPAKTPAKTAAKTPARPFTKTPAKTPAKTPKPANLPKQNTTPEAKQLSAEKKDMNTPQSLTKKTASAKRDTVKDRIKAIEAGPTPAPHRRATSVHVLKKEAPEVKATLKSKHAATKSVPSIAPATAPSISFSNSPLKQDANLPKKRVTSSGLLSTSKPGFVPAKSSKPATTSSFALPGEAVAAKLKVQREERLKKEEAEVEKKPAFKARPVPTRTSRPSVMPRENKASVARLSVRQASGENKENVAPARSLSANIPSKAVTVPGQSTSGVTANSSMRRTNIAPKPAATIESKKSNGPPAISAQASERIASLTSGQQITATKAEAAQQKLKGKEVYDRIRNTTQHQDEERRMKEEAARKARAEAAERGRQASREWAEKQKKKAAMATGIRPTVATEASM